MSEPNNTANEANSETQKRKWKDLGPRLMSAFFMLAITILVVWLGGFWFALIVAAAFSWVMREWEKMITVQPLSNFGIMLMVIVALVPIATVFFGATAGFGVILIGVGIAFFGSTTSRLWRISGLVFFSLVMMALLAIRGSHSPGFAACFFLGTTVWMTDTGAFFFGRLFGGAKLSPEISPAKTWSGALGGLATGSLAGLVIWIINTSSDWWIGLAIALAVSIAGQMGDLSESAIKRLFRIKDSGGSIPGHGGLMDRLDSLTFGTLMLFAIGIVHGGPQMVANGILIW